MLTDEHLLSKAKKLIESKINWGDSNDWSNQDFVALSEKIQEQLNIPLSHVTLKRIWGKVKYDSLPNTHTLNTLVQFVGYENWREFKIHNGKDGAQSEGNAQAVRSTIRFYSPNRRLFKMIDVVSTIILLVGCILILFRQKNHS